jgi:type VI secretion system protein VasJ
MEPADAEKLYKQGLGVLSAYSDWLVSQNPRDPLRFRIPRWNAWTPVRSLPPADGASTQLPPPEKQILDSINQLIGQSNYEQALKESEPRVTQYIFWIDLSYAGAVALKGLGDDWAEALAAVESETYLFIKRLPGIENLTFNDGTPFCSEEAQNWLRSLDQGSGGGEPQADSVDKALAEARKKAAAKDVIGALGSLDSALNADGRVRNRYRLQVGMLKLLARTENAKLAAAYVEDVVKYIDRHNLEEWEPELALEGLGAAYGALRNGEDQAVGELAQKIFARMGRISPAHALRAAGPAE